MNFPVVNLGTSKKSLGQWQCGDLKNELDKAARELSRWQQLFSQFPQYANNTQSYAQFQRAQDEWNKNKAEYDRCMNEANANPYYGYPSWGPSTPPKPPPPPSTTSENVPTPGATSGPELPKHEYAPVATGGRNPETPSTDCSYLGPYAYFDGRQCRSGNMNQMPGGLVNSAMNFGPSGAAQGISPGNIDFNPGSISSANFMGRKVLGQVRLINHPWMGSL